MMSFALIALLFAADPPKIPVPTAEQTQAWKSALATQRAHLVELANRPHFADAAIYAKALDWTLRHNEFNHAKSIDWTLKTIDVGLRRIAALQANELSWLGRAGLSTVHGYTSSLDGSVQPFAVTLPADFDPKSDRKWPLHVHLHGRDDSLTEVKFIGQFEGQKPKVLPTWIQLDVFGRTNNAYRWAGEVDVFEALAAMKRLYPIDDRRITLRGFSMGGAGAWQLGLHYPDRWSSVGAGAGFVDTVNYLRLKEPLSPLHQKLVRIYDATEYALNAADVPTVGYGGELDKQLLAGQTMHKLGETLGVPIKLIVGPQTEHKFHPESEKEFLAFHAAASERGRLPFPGLKEIRFVTCTLKYNQCEWVTIEAQQQQYEPSVVEARVDDDNDVVAVSTKNVGILQIARDVADSIQIDGGEILPLRAAADGLLPGVYYRQLDGQWKGLSYRESRELVTRPELSKRHQMQGPIDDAFMRTFVCVRGTGTPWSSAHADWSRWTFDRFAREYDKHLRAELPVLNDTQVTEAVIEDANLILFGDPGSNTILAKVVDKLPIRWTKTGLVVRGETYNPDQFGVPLVFPNPLNPHRYVVVNSGHTFHEAEFKGSNAQLYPRLGDIAVIEFQRQNDGGYRETVRLNEIFDNRWQLP